MRAIDADAFDERVRAAGGMSEEELTEDFKDGVQAVLYMLSNQPTIQPEPHWIPVTQATPKEDDDYWCTFGAETGWFVDWCSWYQGRWVVWTDNTVSEVRNVIAWCKPMEPYKGGDGMSIELKPCPFRIHGERRESFTVAGEFFYNETFMPCMGKECACFKEDSVDAYCDRNGAFMTMTKEVAE